MIHWSTKRQRREAWASRFIYGLLAIAAFYIMIAICVRAANAAEPQVTEVAHDPHSRMQVPDADAVHAAGAEQRTVIFVIRADSPEGARECVESLSDQTLVNTLAVWVPHPDELANVPLRHSYRIFPDTGTAAWEAALAAPKRFDLIACGRLTATYFQTAPGVKEQSWYEPSLYYRFWIEMRGYKYQGYAHGHQTFTMGDFELYGDNEPFKQSLDDRRLQKAAEPMRGRIDLSLPVGIGTAHVSRTSAILGETLGQRHVYPVYFRAHGPGWGWRLNAVPRDAVAQLVVQLDPQPMGHYDPPVLNFTPEQAVEIAQTHHVMLWPEPRGDGPAIAAKIAEIVKAKAQ